MAEAAERAEMSRQLTTLLIFAGVVAVIILFTGFSPLSVTQHRINLFSSAMIKCDDLRTSFLLLSKPSQARLYIDADPSAPYPPFYYGGIVRITINGDVAKSYDPPLLDKDEVNVTSLLRVGFNEVVIVPKVAAFLCAVQGQGTVSAYIVAVYISDDDGGGGGGGVGGDAAAIAMLAGLAVSIAAVYMYVRRRG
ncbi:MAG: hypothetical protein QXE52_08380 [Candidatus Caldarchaeum sp.]